MRKSVLLGAALLSLLARGPLRAQPANPLSAAAKHTYDIVKDYITRAAAKMPEESYTFRPTPDTRTFAQLIGHIADANYALCGVVAGERPPIRASIEQTTTTKAGLAKALAAAFAYCDGVHARMTDAGGIATVKFTAGGPIAPRPEEMPKLSVLEFNTHHSFEHYGNVITYMRLKGLVPPSSESPASRY